VDRSNCPCNPGCPTTPGGSSPLEEGSLLNAVRLSGSGCEIFFVSLSPDSLTLPLSLTSEEIVVSRPSQRLPVSLGVHSPPLSSSHEKIAQPAAPHPRRRFRLKAVYPLQFVHIYARFPYGFFFPVPSILHRDFKIPHPRGVTPGSVQFFSLISPKKSVRDTLLARLLA